MCFRVRQISVGGVGGNQRGAVSIFGGLIDYAVSTGFFQIIMGTIPNAKLKVVRPPAAYCALGGVAYCGVRRGERGMAGTLRTPPISKNKDARLRSGRK